jgi:hypothetical protein
VSTCLEHKHCDAPFLVQGGLAEAQAQEAHFDAQLVVAFGQLLRVRAR